MKFDVSKEMVSDLLEDGLISGKKYYSNFIINDIMDYLLKEISEKNSTK